MWNKHASVCVYIDKLPYMYVVWDWNAWWDSPWCMQLRIINMYNFGTIPEYVYVWLRYTICQHNLSFFLMQFVAMRL